MSKWEYCETELWRHGAENISLYHVFGVISTKNAVLAFAEAREGNAGDSDCLHHIHMRRSTDGGKTFAKNVCLVPAGVDHCWTNPTPLYDQQTNRLFLFYSDNCQNKRTENLYIFSDDEGITWSEPVSFNRVLDAPENAPGFHLAGPGHGIQLKNGAYAGRLVIHFWHRHKGTDVPAPERGYCLSCLYSDDHGETWQQSDYWGTELQENETVIAETNADIVRLIRSKSLTPYLSRSSDGGASWSAPEPADLAPAQSCDMGIAHISANAPFEDTIVVSRVSDIQKRINLEICISSDGGRTFTDTFRLLPGDVMPGYSDLCVLKEEEPVLGMVSCRNNHVLFSRISLQTLTMGKYDNTQRRVWLW